MHVCIAAPSLNLRSNALKHCALFPACSSLRQLVIEDGRIESCDVDIIRWLPGLTALGLPDCELESLPEGPYLSGLKR